MKKIFYFTLCFAAAVMTASCEKEPAIIQEKEQEPSQVIKYVPVTILAENTDLKTTAERFKDEETGSYMYSIKWSQDDSLSVFTQLEGGETTNCLFKMLKTEGDGKKGTFSGEIPEESEIKHAILPYNARAKMSSDGNIITTTIPSSQNGDFSNVLIASSGMTSGSANDGSISYSSHFQAVSGIVKFTIPTNLDENILSVRIVADKPISGDVAVDYTDGGDVPALKANPNTQKTNVYNTVTIENADGSILKPGDYYAAVIPIVKTDDLKSMGLTLYFTTETQNIAFKNAKLGAADGHNIFAPNVVKNLGTVGNLEYVSARGGLFTIDSQGHKIRFARGNLQYQASSDTWRFATNSWDAQGNLGNCTLPEVGEPYYSYDRKDTLYNYVSEGERAIQSEWIDLFPYGHSGRSNQDSTITYYPYTSAQAHFKDTYPYWYHPGGSYPTIKGTEGDFGVRNPIINGGNLAGVWRLPTMTEYEYVLGYDSWNTAKRPANTITGTTPKGNKYTRDLRFMTCGVDVAGDVRYGIALFPDGFTWPQEISLPYIKDSTDISIGYKFASRQEFVYGLAEFVQLEKYGVIFLPCAGDRSPYGGNPKDFNVNNFNSSGRYMTSDHPGELAKLALYDNNISRESYQSLQTMAVSVRLVMDVDTANELEDYDYSGSEIN